VSASTAGDDRPALPARAKWIVTLAGATGAAVLVCLLIALGPARIATELARLGSVLPAVLIVTGLKYPLQTAGWRLALRREDRPPWNESIASTIAGDALGYMTWAGPVTGEPIRALLTRRSVPVATGIAAGAAERALYNLTAFLLVVGVMLVLAADTRRPVVNLVLAAAVLAGLIGVVAVRRRSRQREPIEPGRDRDHGPAASGGKPASPLGPFRDALRELWRTRRGALPSIALLCLAQHALLVYEAYLLLGVLSGGTTLGTALVFEAVTKVVNTVGAILPGRLGIAEGGSALLADRLGLSASYGLSLALMRRVRALVWAGVGLTLMPLQEARARRSR
jgi:hypothetical protein